ncbi:hypothetical protein E6W36_15360 [Hankyongella ginsenosidimutans]|uniref:Uncharacterized protein n=1 Tax=Hankyongella ginsenosidimutans TaxID=1763828 RepID=A0A4D7C3Q9_9SPHN|nr:hypothetical protein [Hankyongella ginsenosidimutans]QCI80394.1 hypothetical protein E6W36_15360 [Hankyongella ginsenosidimutans]
MGRAAHPGRQPRPDQPASLEDRDIALLLLRNDGYYGANVTTHLRTDPADPTQLEAELSVEPGARYTFSAVRIQTPDDVRPLVESLLNIQTGDVVQTEAILAAEDRLRLELPKRGRPFVMLSDRDILIDHDASAARYTLQVDPGPDAVFGDLRFEGRQACGATTWRACPASRPENPMTNAASTTCARRWSRPACSPPCR